MNISLEAARVNANLSKKEVARHIKVTERTIFNWEKGISSPSILQYVELCKLYNAKIDDIILPNSLQNVDIQ